jgi:hypothetical protein
MKSLALEKIIAAILVSMVSVPCYAYVFSIDEFAVTRNETAIFTDTFSDGNPPPSAPNFLNGNPASYFVRGAMGPESGGKLTLNSVDAAPGTSALGDPFLFQAATLLTDTTSDLTSGLKDDDALSVSGVFDLIAPTIVRESYGINFSDRATGMGLPGDDIVGLRVIDTTSGLRIQFFEASFVDGTFNSIASVPLELNHDQIMLQLSNSITSTSTITASFAYIDGGSMDSLQPMTGSAEIFNGESWTRAQFLARTPVPIPPALWLFGSGLIGLIGVARHKKD